MREEGARGATHEVVLLDSRDRVRVNAEDERNDSTAGEEVAHLVRTAGTLERLGLVLSSVNRTVGAEEGTKGRSHSRVIGSRGNGVGGIGRFVRTRPG